MEAYFDSASRIDSSSRSIDVFEPHGNATYPACEATNGRFNAPVDKTAKSCARRYTFGFERNLYGSKGVGYSCKGVHGSSPDKKH
jgi:hypothetical protein